MAAARPKASMPCGTPCKIGHHPEITGKTSDDGSARGQPGLLSRPGREWHGKPPAGVPFDLLNGSPRDSSNGVLLPVSGCPYQGVGLPQRGSRFHRVAAVVLHLGEKPPHRRFADVW